MDNGLLIDKTGNRKSDPWLSGVVVIVVGVDDVDHGVVVNVLDGKQRSNPVLDTLKTELQILVNVLFRKLGNCELRAKRERRGGGEEGGAREIERGASVFNKVMKANFLSSHFYFLHVTSNEVDTKLSCFRQKN